MDDGGNAVIYYVYLAGPASMGIALPVRLLPMMGLSMVLSHRYGDHFECCPVIASLSVAPQTVYTDDQIKPMLWHLTDGDLFYTFECM